MRTAMSNVIKSNVINMFWFTTNDIWQEFG